MPTTCIFLLVCMSAFNREVCLSFTQLSYCLFLVRLSVPTKNTQKEVGLESKVRQSVLKCRIIRVDMGLRKGIKMYCIKEYLPELKKIVKCIYRKGQHAPQKNIPEVDIYLLSEPPEVFIDLIYSLNTIHIKVNMMIF